MKNIRYLLILFYLFFSNIHSFEKVIIWGHKLHSHTHSYIHNAFYIAFEHLGYKTYWFDDNSDVRNFDFKNSLFLTEGQVDKNIPLRNDCLYILHNCGSKYKPLHEKNRCLTMQVYSDSCLKDNSCIQIAPCIYFTNLGKTLYMPWATDLLPHEVDQMKAKIRSINKNKIMYWIGTANDGTFGNIDVIKEFENASKRFGIRFKFINPWSKPVSVEDNIILTQKSFLAPALQGKWQVSAGYIPCRIFKSISYGQMGITNSYRVYELFDKKIIYNPDPYQLFFDAKNYCEKMNPEDLENLMDFVRDNHTYINRIKVLFDALSIISGEKL